MNCQRCGKTISGKLIKLYCSKACSKSASKKRKTQKKYDRLPPATCCVCGKVFYIYGLRKKTCSDLCTARHKKSLKEKHRREHKDLYTIWRRKHWDKTKLLRDAAKQQNKEMREIKKQRKIDIKSLYSAVRKIKKDILKRDGIHVCGSCSKTVRDAQWDGALWCCISCAKIKRSEYHKSEQGKAASARHLTKIKTTPEWLCKVRIRQRVSKAMRMRAKGIHIGGSKVRYLGCTYKQAFEYITSLLKRNMTWENYGKHWHIDHVFPIASFDLSCESDRHKAFHYTNLQPLEAEANMKKHDSIPNEHQPSLMLTPVMGPQK